MLGMSIISEVLFLAIIISLVVVVYAIASPMIYSMQVASSFEQSKSMMLKIDELIQDVASEGEGSRRAMYVTLGAGTLVLDEATDTLKWLLETDAAIVAPRSMQKAGSLIIGSGLDSMAYEESFAGQDSLVLENEILKVHIRKIAPGTSYNTSQLLLGVYNKKESEWMPLGELAISVDGDADSASGTGFTELAATGYALPRAEAVAHINTTYAFLDNYSVRFVLESGADFIIVSAGA